MPAIRALLESCVNDAGLPTQLVSILLEESPWLDGQSEVHNDFALELLSEPFLKLCLGDSEVQRFISAYNRLVALALYPPSEVQNAAYTACLRAISAYGTNDDYGRGDYCVFDESFSGNRISVTVYGNFRFPANALGALHNVIKEFKAHYGSLEVITEDGNLVAELTP